MRLQKDLRIFFFTLFNILVGTYLERERSAQPSWHAMLENHCGLVFGLIPLPRWGTSVRVLSARGVHVARLGEEQYGAGHCAGAPALVREALRMKVR